ncbi:MAG: hypothetical protein WDO13_00175 [Verrucomicrobiota bacterium]
MNLKSQLHKHIGLKAMMTAAALMLGALRSFNYPTEGRHSSVRARIPPSNISNNMRHAVISFLRDLNYKVWILWSVPIAIADTVIEFYGVDDPESIKTTMEFICMTGELLLSPVTIPKIELAALIQLVVPIQIFGVEATFSEPIQQVLWASLICQYVWFMSSFFD